MKKIAIAFVIFASSLCAQVQLSKNVQIGGTSGGPCGTVSGDNTSTNCGYQNRVGDTAAIPATVQTYGANNLPLNTATEVTAYGHENLNVAVPLAAGQWLWLFGDNNIQGGSAGDAITIKEVAAIGDTNIDVSHFGTTHITDSFFFGELNDSFTGTGSMTQSNILAMGNSNFPITYGTSTNNYQEIVALGDQNASLGFNGVNDTSRDLVAIGDKTMSGYSDIDNIAIGDGAGSGNLSHDVIAMGDFSLINYNNAHDLIGIGDEALNGQALLANALSGHDVIGLGNHTLACDSTGSDNIGIGDYAGSVGWVSASSCGNSNTSGSNNVWIGNEAGPNTTSQLSNTVAIGNQAHPTASNQAVIGSSTITQTLTFGVTVNGTLFSAAGTALPSCVSGLKGATGIVIDATGPTYLANYTSGGTVVSPVMCNGTSWVTY